MTVRPLGIRLRQHRPYLRRRQLHLQLRLRGPARHPYGGSELDFLHGTDAASEPGRQGGGRSAALGELVCSRRTTGGGGHGGVWRVWEGWNGADFGAGGGGKGG